MMGVLGISCESGPLGYGNGEVHLKYLNKLVVSLRVLNPKYTSTLNFLGTKFCKKIFCNPRVTTKITKLFCYENLEPYGITQDKNTGSKFYYT